MPYTLLCVPDSALMPPSSVTVTNVSFTSVGLYAWLEIVRPTVEPTTFGAYNSGVTKRIIPYFDEKHPNLRLVDLTPKMIQDYYTYEMKVNHLSANTVLHRHANIHKALKQAYAVCIFTDRERIQVRQIEYVFGIG